MRFPAARIRLSQWQREFADKLKASGGPVAISSEAVRFLVSDLDKAGARLFTLEVAADVAREFIAYYTGPERHPSGGCGNCGGLPHSDSCFVGRFITALDEGVTDPARVQSADGSQATGSADELSSLRVQLTTETQAHAETRAHLAEAIRRGNSDVLMETQARQEAQRDHAAARLTTRHVEQALTAERAARQQAELARDAALEEARMGHVRLDECSDGVETKGKPLYDRISAKIQKLSEESAEKGHIIKAIANEQDELRARAESAKHRQAAAEYRAQRIVLDEELRAQLTAAEQARAQAEQRFAVHTDAVSAYLNELYAIMVDPLADGEITVTEMRAAILKAAIRDRDRENLLGQKDLNVTVLPDGSCVPAPDRAESLLASLRTALETAGEAIHSEYCGSAKCHPECVAVAAALRGEASVTAPVLSPRTPPRADT